MRARARARAHTHTNTHEHTHQTDLLSALLDSTHEKSSKICRTVVWMGAWRMEDWGRERKRDVGEEEGSRRSTLAEPGTMIPNVCVCVVVCVCAGVGNWCVRERES